ncbi:DNA-processing protein DprA [Furfurilactobacillus siliginis]|uniref:DNA processing protein DprA n=1 Tax=Furfurilactobacillus siliginis TaxID=348151 RepID=A0A0R2LCV8_9LACO|nr:DNA-processing protein DprA [Furfurilactobacillus siliginis]KRN97004.1 DNA protecting protein DprA [Furfurilactobacillus siliginis]GEK27763.1 DNA processing protein DprA [Furfurilactobacillus siliginis]
MQTLITKLNHDFLVRLQLVPGIGLAARRKVWQFLQDHLDEPLTIKQVAQLLALDAIGCTQLFNNWHDDRLTATVLANEQHSQVVTIVDDAYPQHLRELYAAPLALFCHGNLALLNDAGLAIVGARQATTYSYALLKQWLPELVGIKRPIISGLAAGVDSLSHQLAMNNRGQTVAVIGTGLDVAYPASNQSLQQKIASEQLLVSEYPLGTTPAKHHFPERNRIIAGLAQAILVTEAAIHSGSLITANIGLQENRDVLAVPGRVTDRLSAGCNALIAAGATPVSSAEDILNELR